MYCVIARRRLLNLLFVTFTLTSSSPPLEPAPGRKMAEASAFATFLKALSIR